jgi:enoyl-CoA hydratase
VPDRDRRLTAEADALLACMETDDWQEGVDAFAADRDPEFGGE